MTKFTKKISLTELQDIKNNIPDYDHTPLRAEYTSTGEIIYIETEDELLKSVLTVKGFVEEIEIMMISGPTVLQSIKNVLNL